MQHDDSKPMPFDLGGRIRVTREIPLWQILTFLGAVAAQAVGLYYGQQRQTEELNRQGLRQTEMAADLRTITGEMQKGTIEAMKLGFVVNNLEQRVRALESAQPQPQRR